MALKLDEEEAPRAKRRTPSRAKPKPKAAPASRFPSAAEMEAYDRRSQTVSDDQVRRRLRAADQGSRSRSPAPSAERLPATAPGGSGPPAVPPSRALTTSPDPGRRLPVGGGGSGNLPATTPYGMGAPGEQLPARGAGAGGRGPIPLNLGARAARIAGPAAQAMRGGPAAAAAVLGGAALTEGGRYVAESYPGAVATENAVSAETGTRTDSSATPWRGLGGLGRAAERRGRPNVTTAPAGDAGAFGEGPIPTPAPATTPPPRSDAARADDLPPPPPETPLAPPASAARRNAVRRSGQSNESVADELNARELERIHRVNRGEERDRPPQSMADVDWRYDPSRRPLPAAEEARRNRQMLESAPEDIRARGYAKGGLVKKPVKAQPEPAKRGQVIVAKSKPAKDIAKLARGGMLKKPAVKPAVSTMGPGRPKGPPKPFEEDFRSKSGVQPFGRARPKIGAVKPKGLPFKKGGMAKKSPPAKKR